jgi:hypothetical protein
MALPKINVPHYDVTLPSGKRVSFRPFLVKEEKLLMIALESKDSKTMIEAARQILENCVGAISNIAIDKLPLFDVEFLLLQLRARSIGEVVKLRYRCNQQVEKRDDANNTSKLVPCEYVSEYDVNLLEIKPSFGEGHNKYIQLTDTVGVTLKYPTFTSFQSLTKEEATPEDAFAVLLDNIESINDNESVVYAKDIDHQELTEFVDTLTHEQVAKLDRFFLTMPKIQTTIQFKCPKCGAEEAMVVQGLESFFG